MAVRTTIGRLVKALLSTSIVVVGLVVQNASAFQVQPQRYKHCFVRDSDEHQHQQQTALFGKKGWKKGPPRKIVAQTETVYVNADGSDAWKTMDVVDNIREGGVGVIPTDTGYGFITAVDSKDGLERILRIKGMHTCKSPLSVLCSDLSTIDKYCIGVNKQMFKILKRNLPGAYTFIFPASNTLPKAIFFDKKGGKHSWARTTVGVRMPNDPVLRYFQDELLGGMPLLVSPLPADEESEEQLINCSLDPDAQWYNEIDFIVDAGERPYDGSTIFDATRVGEPELVREGLGELELA